MLGVTSDDLAVPRYDPKLVPPAQPDQAVADLGRNYQRFDTPYTVAPPVIMIRTRDN